MIIPIANQHAYNSIPRNAQLGYTIDYRCNAPSRQLVVDWKGDCFVCGCEAWLPISPGKITDFDQLKDVWAHPTAQALQQDIVDGKFTHCAVDRCGVRTRNLFDTRYVVSINIDESCNLACPSCRSDAIMIAQGPDYERKLAQVQHLRRLLEQFEEPCHIVMSGNGDPLASSIMRPLIRDFQPADQQTIRLFTNGLLLEKQLSDSPILDYITEYFISMDAGSADVYHNVRRPGRWDVLMRNLQWLQTVRQRTRSDVLLKFVLQQANYHDVENFCKLCIELGFHGVVNRLEDWGTWTSFSEQDVIGNSQHAEHHQAMENLQRVYGRYAGRIQFNSSLAQLAQS